MARKYRYAFAKQKEAPLGKLSFALFFLSLLVLGGAILASALFQGGGIGGGLCLFSLLVSGYGFVQGVHSLSGSRYAHGYGIFGTIANGLLALGLIGLYLSGLVLL